MEEEWQRNGAYRLEITAGGGKERSEKREGESERVIALQQHLMASLERGRERSAEEEKA